MELAGVRHGRVKHSLHILLNALIDYAGLFPPSGLGMEQVVANYTRYRQAPNAWALGRLIVPAARLPEFEKHFVPDPPTWHISALIGQNVAEDLARVQDFNAHHRFAAVVDTVEAKAASADEMQELRKQVPESILVYFEISSPEDSAKLVKAIGAVHSRAKIRTGGLTQEMFPPAQQIISFLRSCITANVAFKATAGLHHPIRCTKPLTYEKDSPTGTMHGFVNVFLAAAFILEGLSDQDLTGLLLEDNAANFTFEEDAILWRNRRLSHSRLLESRALAASFGSCSFEEPMEDLTVLNLL